MARSGIPSPLKSPTTCEYGLPLDTAIDDVSKPSPGVAAPSAADARDVLPKLVSTNEIVPVGAAEPPKPTTVPVKE